MNRNKNKKEGFYNRSLERALKILTVFNYERNRLTLSRLAELLNLSKATVLRLCTTLLDYGFLRQDPMTKEYALGLRLIELGQIVSQSFSLRETASPFLDQLHRRLGKTLFLGVLERGELVYIDKREDVHNPITFTSKIGTRRPPYWGMVGPVLMADLPEAEVDALLERFPLKATTRKSFTRKEDFKRFLSRVRKEGYAVDRERTFDGITGVAVPIRDRQGKVVAGIGVCFITTAVKAGEMRRIIQAAKGTALAISENLGHPRERIGPGSHTDEEKGSSGRLFFLTMGKKI